MGNRHIFILIDCTLNSEIAQLSANEAGCIYVNYDTITREFQDFFTKSFGRNQSQMNLTAIYAMGFRTSLKTCKDIISCDKDVILSVPSPAYFREIGNLENYKEDVGLTSATTNINYIMAKQDGEFDSEALMVKMGKYTIDIWSENKSFVKESKILDNDITSAVKYISDKIKEISQR